MGCCVSKCKSPQSHPDVQDKLVISHSPPPQSPPLKPPPETVLQSPASLTSASSFTCSTLTTTYDSSSLSTASSSSSVAFSKLDRTFSNDFLQSCAIENPQIIGLDHPVKKIGAVKQLGPGNTLKRARAGSPTLTRQKSFRVEKQRLPCSTMMRSSPSPSRRFNGNTGSYHRRPPIKTQNESNRTIKASRPANPNRNVIGNGRPMRSFGYEIGSKGEDVEVGEVLSRMSYSGYAAMEDLDNPHIALDCFIFL
ncbi:hypothetical protein SSX86_014722 [Deinandra increscens subsp. villosa]|uniref:Uncharacterized protein n=1 Tax=Deinandra increscens subsp. villosa TaxID=3103831 RepID=A0AAP0H022_9ASTR